MRIHLVTVVGVNVVILPHMLKHYAALGFDSMRLNVHLENYDDAILHCVREIAWEFKAEIASIFVGKWLLSVNPFLYGHTQRQNPADWFVLADVDELQVYPEDIHTFFERMERDGFDFVEGCVIDRIARDGGFPDVVKDKSIWEQFPLAGMITFPILKANILKVVAAKGFVKLAPGQHSALDGKGCPREQEYIPVHHFKWWNGLKQRLETRIALYQSYEQTIWRESQRFLDYYEQHNGKFDLADPKLFIAESTEEYALWPDVKQQVLAVAKEHGG